MKRLETAPVVRNRDDVKQARSAYADWYLQTVNHRHAPEMVFVDESGFNLWISRTRGRAHRGQTAVRIVVNQRGANCTLILVVSAVELSMLISSKVEQLLTAAGEGRSVFILDNAPCHRRANLANINPQHFIKSLPPYSPFLNIAGNAFSVWKVAFKQEMAEVRTQLHHQTVPQQRATLVQLATQNLAVVTANKMARSSRRMARLMPRCLNQEDIVQDHA